MKILQNWAKTILAGIVAVLILSGLFTCYLTMPVHIENENGNTDYVWPAGSVWLKMTEGISVGRFDENGYNNVSVVKNPDVLILGSSHMEATNVMQNETVSYLLNEILDDRYTVYNQGISGHHFLKVCKYLANSLSLCERTPRYIVIETSKTTFTDTEIELLINDQIDYTQSNSTGIVASLQKFSFLRLLYNQLDGGLLDLFMSQDNGLESNDVIEETISTESYKKLFDYIDSSLGAYDTQVIIFYHPTEKLQKDGTVLYETEVGTEVFAEKCKEYGYIFVDMTEDFYDMYDESYRLPHGFTTGLIGSGHLNADGHAAVANRIAEVILTLEEEEIDVNN